MIYLVPHAIDRAADLAPEREAVRFQGDHFTYGELSEASNRLACALIDQGVKRGDRVGIYRPKGLESAVAIYAIMKAGAAYVPLDPDVPLARLEYIIRDCDIRHVVADPGRSEMLARLIERNVGLRSLIGIPPNDHLKVECLSWSDVNQFAADLPDVGTMEQDLAYILYTSGSTGVPKGVMHTHRSALSFAEIAADTYCFNETDRLGNHAPLHFDLSTLDFFSSAVAGATTVIIPEICTKLPASLSSLIADERLTVFYAVPFALTQLVLRGALEKRDLSALRWVLFGGEPFAAKYLRSLMALLPQARFSNVYGPTETNGVTYYIVPPLPDGADEPIPIGQLYGNADAFVIDDHDQVVGDGEKGELVVRSPTMMRGYWGRPDLTERAQFRKPVHGYLEEVFHRTGDVVRRLPGGTFVFLGRKDRQVKIRGSRVELDEIEAVLVSHADVEAAAVYLIDDRDGRRYVEASVTAKAGAALQSTELMDHVRDQLPPYSVPEKIVVRSTFPRTSTGKIDRLRVQEQAAASLWTAE